MRNVCLTVNDKDSGPSVSLWHRPILHACMVLNLTCIGSDEIGLLLVPASCAAHQHSDHEYQE